MSVVDVWSVWAALTVDSNPLIKILSLWQLDGQLQITTAQSGCDMLWGIEGAHHTSYHSCWVQYYASSHSRSYGALYQHALTGTRAIDAN